MKRKAYRTASNSRLASTSYGQLEARKLLAADLGLDTSLSTYCTVSEIESLTTETFVDTSTNSESIEASDTSSEQTNDIVLGWNNLFGEILVEDTTNQNPGYASRSMAILNLSIYDAVAVASGDAASTFYDYGISANSNLNAETAASHAAYTVLSSLYPDQQFMIDAHMQEALGNSFVSARYSSSAAVGTAIGNTILDARADDGSDATVEYVYENEIGSFQVDPLNPDVPVWGPAWGDVETFAVSSTESLYPEGTPDLDSAEYAESYNEVLELGSVDSETRTADETEAGIFWAYDREGLGTPMALFGDILETIAVQEGNTFEENAALFAQASVAMADAGIVAWQTKFGEEFWRPVTAIQAGDADGNDSTEGDEDWVALGAPDGGHDIIGFTPQFPTYISGHATFGGALFGAIQEFYGTDDIAFEVASEELEILIENEELQAAYGLELDDASRSFNSLSEAMAENGRSRVYLGIHFDFDDIDGQAVGQAVAAEISSQFSVASEDDSTDGDNDMDGDRERDRGRRRDGDRGHDDNPRRTRRLRSSAIQMRANALDAAFTDFSETDFSRNRRGR
jgi:hypothetical protein